MYCASQSEGATDESSDCGDYNELLSHFRHLRVFGESLKDTCMAAVRSKLPLFSNADPRCI